MHRLLTAALAALLLAAAPSAQTFPETLNPTGDPIGGGPGYSAIVAEAEADFVVDTPSELLAALAAASSGDVIYVEDDAVIDLTGHNTIAVPSGVTLASGRGRATGSRTAPYSEGGLIRSDDVFPNAALTPLFVPGSDVRFTGLRFQGPSNFMLDHEYDTYGVANLVRVTEGNSRFEFDNNEVWGWNKWAVWLAFADGAHVHHNDFHHNMRAGYGYSVWVGGVPGHYGLETLIEANRLSWGRHVIASSGHPYTWEARHNYVGAGVYNHAFDRHGPCPCGVNTTIVRNWFDNEGRNAAAGIPHDTLTFSHNWSLRGTLEAAIETDHDHPRFVAEGNDLDGPPTEHLAVPVISASTLSGAAPLTVHFNGTASHSPLGPIRTYEWDFADGSDQWADHARGASASHTFEAPGRYPVTLTVTDAYGVPSTAEAVVFALPPPDRYVLSAWMMDSYVGDQAGFYEAQVRVNGVVVWSDDVAGDEGWQHVVVDVTDLLAGQPTATVAFRLHTTSGVTDPEAQILEIGLFTDDAWLFGGNLGEPSFENGGVWRTEHTAFGQSYHAVSRSGWNAAFSGGNVGTMTPTGSYSEWYQTTALAPLGAATTEPVAHVRRYGGGSVEVVAKGGIEVFDVLGRLVLRGHERVLLDGLPSGVYLYRASGGRARTVTLAR